MKYYLLMLCMLIAMLCIGCDDGGQVKSTWCEIKLMPEDEQDGSYLMVLGATGQPVRGVRVSFVELVAQNSSHSDVADAEYHEELSDYMTDTEGRLHIPQNLYDRDKQWLIALEPIAQYESALIMAPHPGEHLTVHLTRGRLLAGRISPPFERDHQIHLYAAERDHIYPTSKTLGIPISGVSIDIAADGTFQSSALSPLIYHAIIFDPDGNTVLKRKHIDLRYEDVPDLLIKREDEKVSDM